MAMIRDAEARGDIARRHLDRSHPATPASLVMAARCAAIACC
jgi:hypothetical protein